MREKVSFYLLKIAWGGGQFTEVKIRGATLARPHGISKQSGTGQNNKLSII